MNLNNFLLLIELKYNCLYNYILGVGIKLMNFEVKLYIFCRICESRFYRVELGAYNYCLHKAQDLKLLVEPRSNVKVLE